jgi:hypothetical protein
LRAAVRVQAGAGDGLLPGAVLQLLPELLQLVKREGASRSFRVLEEGLV